MALSKIQAESMNLADTFAFSGTVSGVGGITHFDQWRLNTNFSGAADPISSNLERVDTTGQATIGSAMTFNSGIFSFPVTGKWLIRANWQHSLNGSSRYQSHWIYATLDNSSYHLYDEVITFITHSESGTTYSSGSQEFTLDVTDTSNVKCKFVLAVSSSSVVTLGATDRNHTYFTFIRLGDT
jgi:hypothetical protein